MSNKSPTLGICELCGRSSELQNSHAIPDSLFKSLFRKGSGSAIVLDTDPDADIRTDQESWSAPLLCKECEEKLNFKYDFYGDMFGKGQIGALIFEKNYLRAEGLDRNRLRMLCLSLAWRMSRLRSPAYRDIKLDLRTDQLIQDCLVNSKILGQNNASVCINRLYDTHGFDGFSQSDLDTTIAAPWQKYIQSTQGKQSKHYVIEFIYWGYLISILIPGVSLINRNRPGILYGDSDRMVIPFKDPLQVPELNLIMMRTMDKHHKGQMTKSVLKKINMHDGLKSKVLHPHRG